MNWPVIPFPAFVARREANKRHGQAFSAWFWAAGKRLEAEERKDDRAVHHAIEAMRAAFTARLKIERGIA